MARLIPYHGVEDRAKFERLRDDMAAHGWSGGPLVAHGRELINGSHRYAAWKAAGRAEKDIPVVQLRDVFREYGLDLRAVMREEGSKGPDDAMFVYVLDPLPREAKVKYGIDIH